VIRIATATFQDLAYVASWLSETDREELALTRDPDDYIRLADDAFRSLIHKVAIDDAGIPILAFGATPLGIDIAQVWGFKTKYGARAIPAVTKHVKREMIPTLRSLGVTRAVCLVHRHNLASRKWLAYLGFRPKATEGEFGTPLIYYQRDEPFGRHPDQSPSPLPADA
jgi:hypothetical protein